jgi:hypothetical protein
LPDIDWDEDDIKGGYTIKSSHNYSTEINQLAIDLVEEHCLQQCVTEPTQHLGFLSYKDKLFLACSCINSCYYHLMVTHSIHNIDFMYEIFVGS